VEVCNLLLVAGATVNTQDEVSNSVGRSVTSRYFQWVTSTHIVLMFCFGARSNDNCSHLSLRTMYHSVGTHHFMGLRNGVMLRCANYS
jgi:hypothetical protein